jgi:hypothetical protein
MFIVLREVGWEVNISSIHSDKDQPLLKWRAQ